MSAVEYVMVESTTGMIAEMYREGQYFGSIHQSNHARYPDLYGSEDDNPYIVVSYPDNKNLNQIGVYAPKSTIANVIENLAQLERKPF